MILKDAKEKVELTYQHLIDYAEARWNLIALDVSDKSANIVTSIIVGIVLAILGLFFLVFASISLALWLGDLTNSTALGFLLVAVIYGLIAALMYANRNKWLFLPLMNTFLRKLYRNQDDKLI
ncbi:phage holin family protein [Persicitalea sp.]|uniref:phage holin family protein n=1 Tax=Persicitalea sp. TaxID=3100273 RepID=UPI0035946076